MARTTADAVAGIVDVADDPDKTVTEVLAPFIEVATLLVDTLFTSTTLTSIHLEIIERWLSAHFYKIYDAPAMSETVGPISTTYLFKSGYALNSTTWGQQAMTADTSGVLARYNQQVQSGTLGISAGVSWVGTKVEA